MPMASADVAEAKRAIKDMLNEKPRPTQKMIAAVTGLSQGYVAKISRCTFRTLNPGIRKVVEYSRMSVEKRSTEGKRKAQTASRLSDAVARLAARDPHLSDAVVEFLEKIATRPGT